jgi:hypothetical protein
MVNVATPQNVNVALKFVRRFVEVATAEHSLDEYIDAEASALSAMYCAGWEPSDKHKAFCLKATELEVAESTSKDFAEYVENLSL